MKTTRRILFSLIVLFSSTHGFSQQLVAELEYIKLNPSKLLEFNELRKDVMMPYNQGRLDAGMIIGWGLYERMHTGTDDPYTHIIVSVYDDYLKTENSVNWKWLNENYSEQEGIAIRAKLSETCPVVKEEVYFNVTFIENPADSKYLEIDRINTFKGQSHAFRKLIKEISKPVFELTIAAGVKSSWSVWQKFLYHGSFDYVVVNTYSEFGQWRTLWPATQKAMNKVHPDMNHVEILNKFDDVRSIESKELWKRLDIVKPPA